MKQVIYTVESNERIARDIYRMTLRGDNSAISAPGQFINIKLGGLYLRRPISVCCADDKHITLIYKTVGAGTEALSRFLPGQGLELLLPLGHGFSPDATRDSALLYGLAMVQLIISLLVLAVLALLSYYVVRQAMAPLREVERTAGEIAAKMGLEEEEFRMYFTYFAKLARFEKKLDEL